ARAEECFREALAQEPDTYEALVNLGGVLVTLHKLDEAWDYNLHAVLTRPNDALANSQLGMTYFEAGNPELAEKYLRRGDKQAAVADLESFLKHHPDWPQWTVMREKIAAWKK